MPFGNREFSVNKFNNIRNLSKVINNIEFYNKDFSWFEDFNKDDFVYLDPPYLLTEANYNDNWNDEDELRLFKYLDRLDKIKKELNGECLMFFNQKETLTTS